MARRKKKHSAILIASLAAHAVAFAILAFIPQKKLREVVAIALREAPPKEEKKVVPPKPPEHPPERQARAQARVARSTAAPEPSAAASNTNAAAFTNLGLTLDSNSVDGLAVPVATRPAMIAPQPAAPKPKVLVPRESTCTEDLVKARPLELVRPAYTDEARRARVQGRVRIELALDERGEVTGARVLDGLGYGLDEAALEAARRLRFAPAQRCKRAVAGPFVIAMRFVLNT